MGTATKLPLARRAQLAVVAHIRHLYTDYDRILKLKSFHEARSAVEQATLAKVIEWRGDDENGQTVLEDVFREVIVISDDEDSETEEEGVSRTDTRGQDAQVISTDARAHEINIHPVSTAQLSHQDSSREPSEEAPLEFRVVSKMPTKRAGDPRGTSRYQAWNRALNRHRAEARNTNMPRLGDTSGEQRSPQYAKRPAAIQHSPEPIRRRDIAPQFMNTVHKAVPEPTIVDHSGRRAPASSALDRLSNTDHVTAQERHYPMGSQQAYPQFGINGFPPALTTQKPPEVRVGVPRLPGPDVLYSRDTSHSGQRANVSFERLHPSSKHPVCVGRPKEMHRTREDQVGCGTEAPSSTRSRPAPAPSDYVLPSVETLRPLESRSAEGPLEHLTQRMSLRSVTPARRQGDIVQHERIAEPESPNGQNPKRRRLAHCAAPQQNIRPEIRKVKPIGWPISQGPSSRRPYGRDELIPEPPSQNGAYFDPCSSSAMGQPSPSGIYQGKPPISFVRPQASADARTIIDLTHVVDPHVVDPRSHASVHHPQPDLPSFGNSKVTSGRTVRATDISRSDRPASHGDRSPYMDQARPSEPHASLWKPVDGSHLFTGAPSGARLHADGFVRHVDMQEVHPVQRFVQRSGPGSQHVGEKLNQPMRTRVPNVYATEDPSGVHASTSEQWHPPSPRVVTQTSHNQASRRPEGTFESHRSDPSTRQRRPGNEGSTSR